MESRHPAVLIDESVMRTLFAHQFVYCPSWTVQPGRPQSNFIPFESHL